MRGKDEICSKMYAVDRRSRTDARQFCGRVGEDGRENVEERCRYFRGRVRSEGRAICGVKVERIESRVVASLRR